MTKEWSVAQDGRPGIGFLITCEPAVDDITWRLPLHYRCHMLCLRLRPDGELLCALDRAAETEE